MSDQAQPTAPEQGDVVETRIDPAVKSQAMVVHDQAAAPVPANVQPGRTEWEIIQAQAMVLAEARGVIPSQYIGRPNNIIAAAMFGRTVGFDVASSLRLIHVIDGKPSFSADAMTAMIRRAGHSLQGTVDDEMAFVKGKRRDNGDEFSYTFSMEDARKANLLGKGAKSAWSTFPKSMMWARCVTQVARALFSDVTLGMGYTPEELDPDIELDGQGNPVRGHLAPDGDATSASDRQAVRDLISDQSQAVRDMLKQFCADWRIDPRLSSTTQTDIRRVREEIERLTETDPFLEPEDHVDEASRAGAPRPETTPAPPPAADAPADDPAVGDVVPHAAPQDDETGDHPSDPLETHSGDSVASDEVPPETAPAEGQTFGGSYTTAQKQKLVDEIIETVRAYTTQEVVEQLRLRELPSTGKDATRRAKLAEAMCVAAGVGS